MRIAVIDGQGGGIGKAVVARLRTDFGADVEILALGTNAVATGNMLKNGADAGATGENAVRVNAGKVDIIIGPMAILMSNSMLGEITSVMAEAVSESPARKIIVPLNLCNVHIIGIQALKISEAMDQVAAEVSKHVKVHTEK